MSHLSFILKQLISYEKSEEAKLNMLTSIGLDTTNQQTFDATEEVRDWLFSNKQVQEGQDSGLRSLGYTEDASNFRL